MIYDVALWRRWNGHNLNVQEQFPITDYIEAETPFLAALELMRRTKMRRAEHVVVVGKGHNRSAAWENGGMPLLYSVENAA